MKRNLTLKRETLTALNDGELSLLVGAAITKDGCTFTLLHRWCPSALTCPTEQ